MAKKGQDNQPNATAPPSRPCKPPALLDTRAVYCGDHLEQLAKLSDASIDLIYINPPFNSNRTCEQLSEVFRGETKEERAQPVDSYPPSNFLLRRN